MQVHLPQLYTPLSLPPIFLIVLLCLLGLDLRLRPYAVLVTSPHSGLIETVPDATSIDSLKKNTPGFTTLAQFFIDFFGPIGSKSHSNAQRRFAESMAAYALVTYFLQIKVNSFNHNHHPRDMI